ncbi:zinc finger protein [Trichonephila clavata]|uniref:Zinc finger protein n=1 Tax=Trichonephila clavata TaxID=2740835 RepID=A0A8X6M3J1_TRICU|nr:zinc finger protein [Trichonephila clavata]
MSTTEENFLLNLKANQFEVCTENEKNNLIVSKSNDGKAIQVTENMKFDITNQSINCFEDDLISKYQIDQNEMHSRNEEFVMILPIPNTGNNVSFGESKKTDVRIEGMKCVMDEYEINQFEICAEDEKFETAVNQYEMGVNNETLTSKVLNNSENNFIEEKYICDSLSTLSLPKPPFSDNVCNICFKSFSLSYLKTHLLTHIKDKPFKCSKCSKQYTRKDQLCAHQINHSGEKPFICNVCNKCFFLEDYLINHLCSHLQHISYMCEEGNGLSYRKL